MSKNELIIKRKRLSKSIRSSIVNLNMRESDAAYVIINLLYNKTKQDLVDIVESNDQVIAVQILAHAFLSDYKAGKMTNLAASMQWAFDRLPKETPEDLSLLDEEALEKEIQLLLT